MNNLIRRILLAAFVIPTLLAILFFLPYAHYLALSIAVMFFVYTGAREFIVLSLKSSISKGELNITSLVGLTFPLIAYLEGAINLPEYLSEIIIVSVLSLLFIVQLIKFEKKGMDDFALEKTVASLGAIFYPGFFLSYIVKLSNLPNTSELVLFFLLVVFINDSAAYAFGLLLGRNSWKPFKSSPKKSSAGFIGGILSSIASAVIFTFIFPYVFDYPLWLTGITALLLSVFANLGDLIESVFKRSAGVKDSGTIMMGRGGVLDSIDSLLFAAPLYYFLIVILM